MRHISSKDSTIITYVIGSAGDKAMRIPIQVSGMTVHSIPVDRGIGTIGSAMVNELPYIRSVVSRLLPEMRLFLSNTQLQVEDNFYNCTVIGTSSAQVALALAICALLRKSLSLPTEEFFASTGSLDPLGFITPVEDLLIKRSAVKNMLLIDSSKYKHLFDALHAIGCLIVR